MSLLKKANNYFINNTVFALGVIGVVSFVIKMVYFPYGIPLTEDGLFYFRYATDTSILGHLPSTPISNNGWPLFLSPFFSIFHSNNFLDYMMLQRLLTVLISTVTLIPVYLLTRRFFEPKYAVLGALLFAFEPRTIQNSLLGISESLYILLVTLSLSFFLSSHKNIIYLSFSIAALAVQVRYEGIFLFFVISIMFFIKHRKERRVIGKYAIGLAIFILTMAPLSYAKIITGGSESTTDGLISGAQVYGSEATANQQNGIFGLLAYIFTGLQALVKRLGLIMIPFFVFFVPVGAFLMLKKRNNDNITMIIAIILLSIPALYAYSRGIQESRYLYVLYPIFSILAIFAIKAYQKRVQHIVLITIIVVIISSLVFLSAKNMDYEHEREAFKIATYVAGTTKVINGYYPESKYVRVVAMEDRFPVLSSDVSFGPKILQNDYQSLEQFIKDGKKEGLDHIVVDGKANRPKFFNDVFSDDVKFPYLIKVFDSWDFGYKYHLKMYRIDYEKFDSLYANG